MDLLRAALIGVLASAVSPFASAQITSVHEALTGFRQVAPNVYQRAAWASGDLAATAATRSMVASAVLNVTVTDAVVIAGRSGAVAVAAPAIIAAADAAVAIATVLAVPVGAPLAAAALLYTAYRVFNEDGSLKVDPGMNSQTVQGYHCTYQSKGGDGASISEACGQAMRVWDATQTGNDGTYTNTTVSTLGTCGPSTCAVTYRITSTTNNTASCGQNCTQVIGPISSQASYSAAATQQCPMSVDALNPANTIPAGSPIGPDGKCPTARYNHQPITPADAAARVTANPGYATPQQMVDAVKGVLHGDPAKGIDATPGQITGPATVTSPNPVTTTTTGPSGTTTVRTTPRDSYGYTPSAVTGTPSDIVTTTAPDGTVTTTTTTGAVPATGDQRSECEKSPDTIGCQKMDAPPNVPWEPTTQNVTLTAEAPWGGGGTCPADRTLFNVGTVPVVFSWSLLCQFFTGIRFAVIASAWLTAILIFVGARND